MTLRRLLNVTYTALAQNMSEEELADFDYELEHGSEKLHAKQQRERQRQLIGALGTPLGGPDG